MKRRECVIVLFGAAGGWPRAPRAATTLPRHRAARRTRDVSFKHLVGEQLHRVGNRQPQRLRGLEIDHQLEFGRLHDRQIRGVGPPEDAAGVDAYLTVCISDAVSVAHEAAGRCYGPRSVRLSSGSRPMDWSDSAVRRWQRHWAPARATAAGVSPPAEQRTE